MIPSLNNFELSLKFSDAKNFKQGVEMIYSQLKSNLNSFGLVKKEFNQGDNFDPKFHHPIEVIETEDEKLDNTLCEVLNSAYLLKDSVLKPADVKVYSFKSNNDKNNDKNIEKNDEKILNDLIENEDKNDSDIFDENKDDLEKNNENLENSN